MRSVISTHNFSFQERILYRGAYERQGCIIGPNFESGFFYNRTGLLNFKKIVAHATKRPTLTWANPVLTMQPCLPKDVALPSSTII